MCRHPFRRTSLTRICARAPISLALMGLAACGNILDVEFPGRIPAEQLDNPTLAPVLAGSVVGDLECAYNNYNMSAAVHSDEFEGTSKNSLVTALTNRGITADESVYASGGCETGPFFGAGLHTPMQTARFQSEDVFRRLSALTDAQVPNRTTLMATVRAYGAYAYTFFGETYCSIAFDRGPEVQPVEALRRAEAGFTEAISLAQTAGATDILNLARVGMARVKMNLKKWSEAATFATQVPPGYRKDADRGTENDRRYNVFFVVAQQNAVVVVAEAYRTLNDPRVKVGDGGRETVVPGVRLIITTKYLALNSPIRLATYEEARLILAEAQAEQGQVAQAQQTINTYRAAYSLPALTFANQADAITKIIEERRRELSFEGGHRLNDLLRKGTSWKVGANPYDGRPYGTTSCWPFPTQEKSSF